jgi:hypothetical protein
MAPGLHRERDVRRRMAAPGDATHGPRACARPPGSVDARIQRSVEGKQVRLTMSGRIEPEHLAELQDIIRDEAPHHALVVDLKEVKLVDRDAVEFVAQCEARARQARELPCVCP